MEFYSVIKRKEVLIHDTLWINLENIILSEISQLQKSIYYMILFIGSLKREIIETESRPVVN